MSQPTSSQAYMQRIAALEQQLKELRKFAALFHSAEDGMALKGFDGRFREVNAAFCAALGYSREELLNMRAIDLKPPALHAEFKKEQEHVRKEGNMRLETVCLRKDGVPVFLELSASIVQLEDEELIHVVARDITERKRREETLRRYEKIFALSQDRIAYVDADYIYTMANEQFCTDTRKGRDEIIGHSVAEVLGEKVFTEAVKGRLDRCLSGETVHDREWFEYPAIGRRYQEVTYYPDRLTDGAIRGAFAVIHDLTDLNITQEAKEAEQTLLSHLLANITGGIYLITKSHDILYVNPYLEKMRGPVRNRKCYEYVVGRQKPCPWCKNSKIFSSGGPIHWIYESENDGKTFDVFEEVVHSTRFGTAKVTFLHDITEFRKTEQELHAKTQLFDAIVNNSTALISVKDREGRFLLVNKRFAEVFQSPAGELEGKTDFDISPTLYAKQCRDNDKAVLTADRTLTFDEKVFYEGKEHLCLSIKFPIYDNRRVPSAVGGITMDITDRKQMERMVRDKNEQLLSLINATPDLIYFKDGEGRWLLANKAGLQLFHLEDVDYVGKTDAQLAGYREFYSAAFLTCQETDKTAWKGKAIAYGQERIPQPDGTIKIYDIMKVPLFHSDGSRKSLVVIGRDSTEAIRAGQELQKKTKEIHDTNIALRVLLDQQKSSQHQLEQQILENLRRLVFPYLELLARTQLQDEGREYLQLITAHLNFLLNSFCSKLDSPTIGLTPKELLVADMVRQGKSSADIGKLLNLTVRTVEVYRNTIRKKLKISGKKINLHCYLKDTFL